MSESALDIAAARAADPYDAFPGYGLTIELIDEALALRAELERVRGERDALAHWRQKFHELAAENTRLESERDQYIERCEDLQTVQLRMVEELARVEGEARVARVERDAARAAAGAFVFEVVDYTDDEVYHTIGVWPDLQSALDMVRQYADDPDGLERNGYVDDYCRVAIYRRPLGEISDSGFQVREFIWTTDYNEELDEYTWKMQEIANND